MDLMDLDNDMDVDIDLVPDEPIVPEPDPGNRSPGEIDDDADARCPSKIYIKGLDVMNPDDVKAYVAAHCSSDLMRIEWIDDNSANLLFASEDVASQALVTLAADPVSDVSRLPARHLLPAKPFPAKPEVVLHIRPALETDKKQAGAASRSRFYLLNPEYDPEERRRRNETRRYRNRDGGGLPPRHGYGRPLRDDEGEALFDVNLYDDNPAATATSPARARPRRRRSPTPEFETMESEINSYRSLNRGRELFPDSIGSRRRASSGRSASPARDRDSDRNIGGLARDRSATAREQNRSKARAMKSHMSRQNRAKELFPAEPTTEGGRLGDGVEDAAILLSKGIVLPLMDGSNDTSVPASRKLADRITIPRESKLVDRITPSDPTAASAFFIRGAASQTKGSNTGLAIKGSAGKSAKELFPDKFGSNAGKELFRDGSTGRARQRQRAGDLFD
ncbi:hypothetical protein F4777DRAFT_518965 [Nemania sp. FL0916]|nr:hypothetical protein F4777DRAFT_518965 [Nemania sp. FL0916]